MKWNLIALVLVIVISIFFASQLLSDPGYVLITFKNEALETSFALALIALMAIFSTLFLTIEILRRAKFWYSGQTSAKAVNNTRMGLMQLASGDWKKAEQSHLKAAKQSEVPLLNYLSAAQAAAEMGQDEQRDKHLAHAAELEQGQADLAVGLTQAQLQFNRGQWQEALSKLLELKNKFPKNVAVLKLLAQVYQQMGDWDKLAGLTPSLKKMKVFGVEDFQALEYTAYANLLKSAHEELVPGSNGAEGSINLTKLRTAWDRVPKHLKKSSDFVALYVEELAACNDVVNATSIIEEHLKKGWSDQLVRCYGLLEGGYTQHRLATAEGWLRVQPKNATLLLTLGRIALESKQLENAEQFLKESLEVNSSPEVNQLLGQLMAEKGQHEESSQYFMASLA